jgi:LysR family transcriptional regulator, carnitine catabolism transcriptional activator
MTLTLRQLEMLAAAADSATFSAAAKHLGISQPALSEAIRRIERETGTALFERTTRSLKLTDAGRAAAAIGREAVRDFNRAMERMKPGSGGKRGRITMACLPSIVCTAMPSVLADFTRDHSGVDVALHDVQHERAMEMVSEGHADIAITIKPAKSDDLTFDAVASDVAHLVCRRDHALAHRRSVRWRDLADVPFIGITRISSVRRLTDAAFVHSEMSVEPRYEVEQVPSAIALVEAGLGVTALPSLTFAMFKGRELAVRPLLEPSLRRNVGFVTRKGRNLPPHSDVLMRLARDALTRELRNVQDKRSHSAPGRS